MGDIETDYLVVGAGATGMAFADSLVAESDADVVLVDRRHGPGGHWNDAYPFVRLHQPSAFYGVTSTVLGSDRIDVDGPNAGFYERSTGGQVLDYYQRVLDEKLLGSGRVRFFGMHDHVAGSGGHRLVARLTGEVTTVRVRRKVVDATYLETSVPSTHTPSFDVEPAGSGGRTQPAGSGGRTQPAGSGGTSPADPRLVTVNQLVDVEEPPSGYTVIGGGKTGMDACAWLLDRGVPPDAIRWIRPRDSWVLDRAYQQPKELVVNLVEGVSLYLEAAAQAESIHDLFLRLEASGQMLRLDPEVEPAMYHCATLDHAELADLRRIEDVVRLGRVRHIGTDRIVLDHGTIPTDPGHLHIDCSARALRFPPPRPIFEEGRITLQQVRACQPAFNAALLAFVEATRGDDADKNRLCPPNPYPNRPVDWMSGTVISQTAQFLWSGEPDLVEWMERCRLNAAAGIGERANDRAMRRALTRLFGNMGQAISNLERLLAPAA